jgi:hypothetical protein
MFSNGLVVDDELADECHNLGDLNAYQDKLVEAEQICTSGRCKACASCLPSMTASSFSFVVFHPHISGSRFKIMPGMPTPFLSNLV